MGEKVTSAVITRPVNFSAAQLDELKQAAQQAGFARVDFTTEPEAAGLAFCRLQATKAFKGNALIVDWGGGTLDIALVSRDGDTVHTHRDFTDGDITMGGETFDARLWEFTESQLKQQGITLNHVTMLPKVRKGKEQLSTVETVTIRLSYEGGSCPPLQVNRNQFEEMIIADVDCAVSKVEKYSNAYQLIANRKCLFW